MAFGILRGLCAFGKLRKYAIKLTESYLSDWTFRVTIGSTLSKAFTQETGMPHRTVLSCTRFIVKMNSLCIVLLPTMSYSLHVYDMQIGFKSSSLSSFKRRIQLSVNKLSKWADKSGCKFISSRGACVLFSKEGA